MATKITVNKKTIARILDDPSPQLMLPDENGVRHQIDPEKLGTAIRRAHERRELTFKYGQFEIECVNPESIIDSLASAAVRIIAAAGDHGPKIAFSVATILISTALKNRIGD